MRNGTTVLDWSNAPFAKWFTGAKTNVSYNCLDRHLNGPRRQTRDYFRRRARRSADHYFAELHQLVCRFANVLKSRGFKAGDRAIIYMPMIPEAAVAMLACARLGVTHSVVFGGFSAEALKARIQDLDARLVITADGGWRRGKEVRLKPAVDEALQECPNVSDVIVYQRTGTGLPMNEGRDHWWHDLDEGVADECPAERWIPSTRCTFSILPAPQADRKAFCIRPAAIFCRRTMTMKWIFDMQDKDIYWCTADIGWVTGHSYVVYGPLSAGATTLIYEGAPDFPPYRSLVGIIEKYRVTSSTRPRRRSALLSARASSGRTGTIFPVCACSAPLASHQSSGMGVVSPRDWQRPLPDCGYVVAD